MDLRIFTSRTPPGAELEQALADWIDASRRAYEVTHDPGDEQAERAAWQRVQSMLALVETPTAA